jgi:hypothetical protein
MALGGAGELVLADITQLKNQTPVPQCDIVATDIRFNYETTPSGPRITNVNIHGVAWGVSSVDVQLLDRSGTSISSTNASVDTNQEWTALFDLSASPVPYGLAVSFSIDSPASATCQVHTTASAVLGMGIPKITSLDPIVGKEAGFEAERNQFVADHADQLLPLRIFVPSICSFQIPRRKFAFDLTMLANRMGLSRQEAIKWSSQITEAIQATATKLQDRSKKDRKTLHQIEIYKSIATDLKDKELDPELPSLAIFGQENLDRVKRDILRQLAGVSSKRKEAQKQVSGGPPPLFTQASTLVQALVNSNSVHVGGGPMLPPGVDIALQLPTLWLGVVFYDRLRIRPTGIVAGDHVYSLAVAPGEEITLTQRSETKKTRSFEEVISREQERQLEFSSTWSTDVSRGTSDTYSSQLSTSMGATIGVQISVVNVGYSASVDTTDSHTTSRDYQASLSREISNRAGTTLRREHKTTFTISEEVVEESGARRIIRNSNSSKALTLNFYKLYNKFHIYLERYDARLCIQLCVYDPAKISIQQMQQMRVRAFHR